MSELMNLCTQVKSYKFYRITVGKFEDLEFGDEDDVNMT